MKSGGNDKKMRPKASRTRAFHPALQKEPDSINTAANTAQRNDVDIMGAALAHELNQPLAALSIYLHSLQKLSASLAGDTAPMLRELVDKALRETARTSDIVRRMRRFTSRSEPERQLVDMNAIAEESIDVAVIGNSRRTVIERRYEIKLPLILADPNQIRQVMVNLLRNAVEATGNCPSPRITVTTLSHGRTISVIVADNGAGIEEWNVSRLFSAFESRKPHGMGLGLVISRMIAQAHGGDLVLEPVSGDSGACFRLHLPLQ
jgi:two-component system, LuxR family, sensor kinase FixL